MKEMKRSWWKLIGVLLIVYAVAGGLLFEVPVLPVLGETIRSIYFHVGMWFGMLFILAVSLVYSVRYLLFRQINDDLRALSAAKVGLLFGLLGLLTGMVWAKFTWGSFWVNDPKLNGAVLGVLTYLAYFALRGSLNEPDRRATLAGVYNAFAFVLFFVFIMVLPRLAVASIHPGIDGNPALSVSELAPGMRKVFFPAMAGWFLMAWWLFTLLFRMEKLQLDIQELTDHKQF